MTFLIDNSFLKAKQNLILECFIFPVFENLWQRRPVPRSLLPRSGRSNESWRGSLPGIESSAAAPRVPQGRLPVFVAIGRLVRMFSSVRGRNSAPEGHLPSRQCLRMDRPGAGVVRMQRNAKAVGSARVQPRKLSRSLRLASIGMAALCHFQMRPPGFPETIASVRQQPDRIESVAIVLSARISTHSQEAMPCHPL